MRRGMVQVFRDSGDGVESPSVGAGWDTHADLQL